MTEDPFELAEELETKLQAPGLLVSLLNDDDWSFFIKLSALLEAAVTHLLLQRIGDEAAGPISRMALSDERRGKVALAVSLGLLDKRLSKFIVGVSQVRNKYAHDVRRVSDSFADYLEGIQDPRGLWRCFMLGAGADVDQETARQHLQQFGRQIVHWAAVRTLAVIYLEADTESLKKQSAEKLRTLWDQQ